MSSNLRPSDFFAIGAAVSIWTSIHVVLRILCRRLVNIPYGLDDFWAVAGWVILIGLNVSSGYLYLGGHLEEPVDEISPHAMDIVLKAWYANHIMYFFVMLCCKLSLIFFYIRLFTTKLFRIAAFTVALLCLAAFVGGLTPFAVQCKPTAATLIPGEPDTCLSIPPLFLGINLSNFLTNVFVLLLPMPFVWTLNLSVRSRVALSFVFMMGGIACVMSLVRVILQGEWLVNFNTMVGECSLWTVIEPAICLFAACLPALRPLIPRSANLKALTANSPEDVSSYERDPPYPARGGSGKRLSELKTEPGWSSDSTAAPANVAYAECYHPLDAYGRAYHNVRSSFNPDHVSQDARSSGSFKNQQSWFDEPDTPPTGIMVRNEVFVDEGFSPKDSPKG